MVAEVPLTALSFAIVDVHDPWACPKDAHKEYGLTLLKEMPRVGSYDAIILAVAHCPYCDMGPGAIRKLGRDGAVFFDAKAVFALHESDGRL